MSKYPALSTISGFMAVVGWLVLIAGGLAFLVVLVSILSASNNPFAAAIGVSLIFGSAQLGLFGLLLAANGELIKVFIDIEANTARMAGPVPSSTSHVTSAIPQGPVATPDKAPLPIPPGFQQGSDQSLGMGDRVFDPQSGEGVVARRGRNRYFVIVRFDQDGAELEKEAFGLYRRK